VKQEITMRTHSTAQITPGRRALAAGLAWVVCSAQAADPAGYFSVRFEDQTSALCRTTPVTASFDGALHRYSGEGDCRLQVFSASPDPKLPPIDPQRAAAYHRFRWWGQYDARSGRTTERLKFEFRQTDKHQVGTEVQLEQRCPVDLWLGPPSNWAWAGSSEPWWNDNACQLVRLETQGNLLSARGDSGIMRRGFEASRPRWPYTSRTLFGDEQLRLRDQLALAEKAQRAARIANATTGAVRDASPTRQGATGFDPATSLRDASPTRSVAAPAARLPASSPTSRAGSAFNR
jgi:hypothetical protein